MRPRSKFGLRSGNSFHFGGKLSTSWKLRHSCAQNVIIKTIVNHADEGLRPLPDAVVGVQQRRSLMALVSWLVPDGGLPFDDGWTIRPEERSNADLGGVSLTLNKRRRWLLPKLIDNAIDRLRQEDFDGWFVINIFVIKSFIYSSYILGIRTVALHYNSLLHGVCFVLCFYVRYFI